jgi:hypothetical protein
MKFWPFGPKPKQPKWKINLHGSVTRDPTIAGAWTTYAGVKVFYRTGKYFETNPEAREHQSPFEEECCARDAMAEFWEAQKRQKQEADAYLQLLVSIRRAGFIREYVWRYLRQDGAATPSRLNLPAFDEWAAERDLAHHKPLTLAIPTRA